MPYLFSRSWLETQQDNLRAAMSDVDQLDRPVFDQPDLARVLDGIADRYTLEVASLDKEGIRATGRTVKREKNDYGERIMIDVPFLDVQIPFFGNPETLHIAPSRCNVLDNNVEIRHGMLVLSIPDDANADREVKDFVERASENLNRLRDEAQRSQTHLRQALNEVVERRRRTISEEAGRDSKRSFPVQR
jgi:hypothetical protein